jgi:hypothetical protein
MTEMTKILTAFVWSMVLAMLAGLVAWGLLFWLEFPWFVYPAVTCGLTIISAWIDSRELLARRLGRRYEPELRFSGRDIPIAAGGLAMSFESVIPWAKKRAVTIEDELSIMTETGLLISGDRIRHFLGRAWRRQLSGKSGLSRPYWTSEHRPAWDRSEYEAMLHVLQAGGWIENRRPGRSGRLIADYGTIVRALKSGR